MELQSPSTVFQELYDEIQQLGRQQSLAVALASKQPSALLRHKDIDELLAYSKKFIKDTRIELTSYSEQAVQCAFDSTVVTSPPSHWPSDDDLSIAGSLNPASAVKIVKKLSPPAVLNNERAAVNVQTPQHVRNIGTNVNFLPAAKCTNVSVQSETVAKVTKETQTAPPVVREPTVPRARIWRLCTQKANEEVRKLAGKAKEKPRSGRKQPTVVAEPKCQEDEREEQTVVDQDEERTNEQPAITKCVMPSTSIEGSWSASLKVQTTSKINIVHVKDNGKSSIPAQNIGYMEFRHESLEIANQGGDQEQVVESPEELVKALEEEIVDMPDTIASPQHRDLEETIIRIPKTVQKIVNSAKRSKKPNRYLQPFMSLGKDAPSPRPTITVELFDEESSATSDEDTVDPVVTDLLSLHRKKTTQSADKTSSHNVTPQTSRSKQSLQDVSSVPTLKSPPAPEEILMRDGTSGKFIEKLRIWRSALEMQSQNMKLGNQLTENLDTLKQNMKIISTESKHIAQISENFESNLKRMERLTATGQQRQPSAHSANASCECFGCRTTYEVPSLSPLSMPSHKSFQRVLLEQSPRYGRTIRNICTEGAEQGFRRPAVPTEVVERAARKFLDTCKRTISSGSLVSGTSSPVASLLSLAQTSSNSRGSRDTASNGGEPHSHSFSSGSMDLVLSGTDQEQDSSGSLRQVALFSDEGEVLSQGEVR